MGFLRRFLVGNQQTPGPSQALLRRVDAGPALVGEIIPPTPRVVPVEGPTFRPIVHVVPISDLDRETNAQAVAMGMSPIYSPRLAIDPDQDPPGFESNTEENYQILLAASEHAEATGEPLVIPPLRFSPRPRGPGYA